MNIQINEDDRRKNSFLSSNYLAIINLILYPLSFMYFLYAEFNFIIEKIMELPNDRILYGNYAIYSADILWFYYILITLTCIFVIFMILRDIFQMEYLNKDKNQNKYNTLKPYLIIFILIESIYMIFSIWHLFNSITNPLFFGDLIFGYFILLFGMYFIIFYLFIHLNKRIFIIYLSTNKEPEIKSLKIYNIVLLLISAIQVALFIL